MKKPLIILLILLLSVISCKEDKVFLKEDLQGYWMVVGAKRNGKTTKSLRGAWIKFRDMEMVDNFLSDKEIHPYSLKGSTLIHHVEPERKYSLHRVTADTLELSTTLDAYKFDLTLERKYETQ